MKSKIESITNAKSFLFGGKAIFTIVSTKTNKRFTFKVNKLKDKDKNEDVPFFVSYLNGSDNETSYQFIGTIFNRKNYKHSIKSKTKKDSQINKTIDWLIDVLNNNDKTRFEKIEFWHEGKCAKCGRKLTDPVSIKTGKGPICSK